MLASARRPHPGTTGDLDQGHAGAETQPVAGSGGVPAAASALLASRLGALALVWATVVLLGGFSTMLGTMDFWFTAAVVFVETARYVI